MAQMDITAKDRLQALCREKDIPVLWEEPMKNHTSFKIGGPATALCTPKNRDQLAALLCYLQENKVDSWFVGNGSNLLVRDEGLDGVVVLLDGDFDGDIVVDHNIVEAPAGKKLSAVCAAACQHGLSGLEFAYGIPGSVGGAVYMNAGAYGGEMRDRLVWCEYLLADGQICRLPVEKLNLSYRHSCFMDVLAGACIVRAAFLLQEGSQPEIQEKMDDIYQRRRDKQPLEYPSAGSTFKRPEGAFAAKLIDDCGLRGFSVGGAQVSQKHAGFVINANHATCADVLALTDKVRQIVRDKTGFTLELEVRLLP